MQEILKKVFDSNFNMKLCGRENCKELLLELEKMYPNEVFGDRSSGVLDINKIRKYLLQKGNLE